jgi:radical SAM protein with 4Fe4S-binding SPASM domain
MQQKTIYVKTTGTCNLNCSHCFTNGKSGDKTQFCPDTVGDWVTDFMSRYPVGTHYHMELHGGEPFLVPLAKLTQFADRFHGHEHVSICANSNLTFKITDEHLAFIKTYFNSYIGTSWDHWIRWSNQKQFDLWRSNLDLLHQHGIGIGLKVSVSRPLLEMSPDWFIDQMESFGVEDVSLERLTMDGSASENLDIFPDNEKQDDWYLALYLRYKERKPNVRIKTLDIIEMKLKNNMVKVDTNCRDCEQNLVTINSNGTLSGCPNTATQKHHATLEQGVTAFLESDGRVEEIVKELTWGDTCLTCDVYDLCGGDCHRLPWQGSRCGGLKNTLRFLSGRNVQTNLIFKG